MATTNDVTGDTLITPSTTQAYRDNYDRIFGRPKGDLEIADEERLGNDGTGTEESGDSSIGESNSSS